MIKHVWIDKKNWRTKVTKRQKNILYDKCQVDFLNNRYLNNREQKRILYNKQFLIIIILRFW